MSEHTFKPGDRAYHVVRREVVSWGPLTYTEHGYLRTEPHFGQVVLPLWHPDVPERCREKRKRKVEVVAWANVFTPDTMELYWTKSEAKESAYRGEPMVATAVELRGSYEVDDE